MKSLKKTRKIRREENKIVIDLDDINLDITLIDDVQENIKNIYKKYGKKFLIKHKSNTIPVSLEKVLLDTYNEQIFCLYYDIEKRHDDLIPFSIYFIDPLTSELNNNTYISDIHRTDDINGSTMVKIVLKINEVLRVKKTSLYDATTIECNTQTYDLSYFKLIEKGITFYMKFGFDFDMGSIDMFYTRFKSVDDLKIKIKEILEKIKKIKVKNLIDEYQETLDILNDVVKKQDYNNFNIVLNDYNSYLIIPYRRYYKKNPEKYISELFKESNIMLNILKDNAMKYEYFTDFIIELFNSKDKCVLYDRISEYIFYSDRYKIIYGKKSVERDYIGWFEYLNILRSKMIFSYYF
jgi:hypothetical protein